MKQGWEIKKLGEVVNVINGRNQAAVISENGQYPIYGSAGNLMGYATDYLCEEGTTIIGRKGNISHPIYIEEKFWNVDTAFGLYPKNGYEPKFINYLCQTIDFKSRNRGTTIPSLVKSDLLSIDVPFISSLPEQQHIISILDEAFAAIAKAKANAEQNLKNAKELFETYLKVVFEQKREGWEEKKLKEIFHIGSSKRIMEKDWTTSGVPFYGGKEIVKLSKFGSVVSNAYISNEKYNEYASKYDMPQQGDILITARGTIGVGYIVQKDNKFYYKDGNIISMRAKIATNPKFILYALKSNAIYDQLKKLTGATVTHLPIERAKELLLMIPNYSTQNFFVEKIEEIEAETQKLETVYQKKIADLEELKKSILQKAFAGELRGGEPAEPKTEKIEIA